MNRIINKILNRAVSAREEISKDFTSFFLIALFLSLSIILAFTGIIFVKEKMDKEGSSEYVRDLIEYNNIKKDEKYNFANNHYNNASTNIIKLFWGLRVLEILRESKDDIGESNLLGELIIIRLKSKTLRRILAVEFLRKEIQLGNIKPKDNTDRINYAIKLLKKVKPKDPLFSLSTETLLNVLLEEGENDMYVARAKQALPLLSADCYSRVKEKLDIIINNDKRDIEKLNTALETN